MLLLMPFDGKEKRIIMWKIKHIFDGDYGCEENNFPRTVSVTLINEKNEERIENVSDIWLIENNLNEGSVWPDFSKSQSL